VERRARGVREEGFYPSGNSEDARERWHQRGGWEEDERSGVGRGMSNEVRGRGGAGFTMGRGEREMRERGLARASSVCCCTSFASKTATRMAH